MINKIGKRKFNAVIYQYCFYINLLNIKNCIVSLKTSLRPWTKINNKNYSKCYKMSMG